MTAKEVAAPSIRSMSREKQHVYKDGGEAVTTTIVNFFDLPLTGNETGRKIAQILKRNTDMQAEFMESHSARLTVGN